MHRDKEEKNSDKRASGDTPEANYSPPLELELYKKRHALWFRIIAIVLIISFLWQQCGLAELIPQEPDPNRSGFFTTEQVQSAQQAQEELIQQKHTIENYFQTLSPTE